MTSARSRASLTVSRRSDSESVAARRSGTLFAIGLLISVGVQLDYALQGPGFGWQDTALYEQVGRQALWSSGFWVGARPPLIPLLFKISADNQTAFLVLQSVVAIAAWGFLAWSVFRWVRPGWRAVVAAWLVLGFSLSPYVIEWNASGLSESLSISCLAGLFASALWLARRFTWLRAAGVVVAATAGCLARDDGVPTAFLLGIGFVGLAVIAAVRRQPARVKRGAAVGMVLLLVAVTCELGALSSHRNVTNLRDDLAVRVFPVYSNLQWFAQHGMPQRHGIEDLPSFELGGSAETRGDPGVFVGYNDRSWRPLTSWIRAHGETTYLGFLLEHPWWDVSAPFVDASMVYNSPSSLGFYAFPGHRTIPGTAVVFPLRIVVVVEMAGALLLVALRRLWSRDVAILVWMLPLGLVTALLAWQADSQEVARHMIEGDIIVRLATLLLVIAVLLGRRQFPVLAQASAADQ